MDSIILLMYTEIKNVLLSYQHFSFNAKIHKLQRRVT